MVSSDVFDPIRAATAANPYPYYAELIATRPFYRDEQIGMWVATSAKAVDDVFASPAMRVRPAAEPVPKALIGTPMGETFGHLVRMTDGASQMAMKSAMSRALDRIDLHGVAAISERCATVLQSAVSENDATAVNSFALGLPALVTATLLGFAPGNATAAIDWTRHFVNALAPGATHANIEAGVPATTALLSSVRRLFASPAKDGSLLALLVQETQRHGISEDVVDANLVGLFLQGYEGTAGLIGNTLVALQSRSAEFHRSLCDDAASMQAFVVAVARDDSPVQNTRRFAADDVTLCGWNVAAGDAVLVVLAAANRDPQGERLYTFGSGAHACNGMRMAVAIAATGVACLLQSGTDPAALTLGGYLPRGNVRVPVFR